MDPRTLLVSDPPHNEVDPISAAPHFHLTAAEVRMKAAYGVPEIWFAQEDRAALEETAAALTEAGLRTVVLEGSDLVDMPPQSPAVSVAISAQLSSRGRLRRRTPNLGAEEGKRARLTSRPFSTSTCPRTRDCAGSPSSTASPTCRGCPRTWPDRSAFSMSRRSAKPASTMRTSIDVWWT